ncbi:MAG: hypothetical protein KGZ85_14295 [Ignavibacterium sp.]|nr:hypothetical protein [Ignavibacterium sp.]
MKKLLVLHYIFFIFIFYSLKAIQTEYVFSSFDTDIILFDEYKINFCRSVIDQLSGECIINGTVNCKILNNSFDARLNTNSLMVEIDLNAELSPLYCNKYTEPCFISGTSSHHFTFIDSGKKNLRIEYPFTFWDAKILSVIYEFSNDGLYIKNMCVI